MSSDESLFENNEETPNIETSVQAAAVDYVDEHYVIAETPQKVKSQKRVIKRVKVKDIDKLQTECTAVASQTHLLHEFYVTRNDSEFIHLNDYDLVYINSRYKSPHVFFEIRELLNFSECYQPINNNIKTFGIYKQNRVNTHCLMEHRKNDVKILPMNILLDFKLLSSFPTINEAVEIYGFVDYYKSLKKQFVVFVVNMWTNVSFNFNKYLKCLKRQKLYVPYCYKKAIEFEKGKLNNLEVSRSIDYYFEEVDERWLNENVEYIEQICHEIDQIMNISEDIFR